MSKCPNCGEEIDIKQFKKAIDGLLYGDLKEARLSSTCSACGIENGILIEITIDVV
jgi:predicted RNA-binding Zn-ribbon protein involved in translation (DUF1610 family)